MAGPSIWRWVLLRVARFPGSWVLGLALLGVPLLLRTLTPLGAPVEPGVAYLLPWLFPAGWIGATLSLSILSSGEVFQRRLPAQVRWGGELEALFLSAALMQLPIEVGALLAGAQSVDLLRALPGILAFDLHLASVALLSLLVQLPSAVRALLLASLIWFVPSLLASANTPLRAFAATLARPGEARVTFLSIAPTLALCLAGHLLRTRQSSSAVGPLDS